MNANSADPLAVFNPFIQTQQNVSQLLTQAVRHSTLAHAYLFKGALSIGEPLVLALAQAVFCEQQGCGHCAVCHSILNKQYPDFHWIEAENATGPIKLAQIQYLVNQVALPPVQSELHIFVIAQAERMNAESSNALLKTLEEPSSNAIIVLLSPMAERLLPTIRSRTQTLLLASPLPSVASLHAQSAQPESFWDWIELEKIQNPEQLQNLQAHLASLTRPDLVLQYQIFQRACWQKIKEFIINKQSIAGLKRAYAYLDLFESALGQLHANAHLQLVISSFAYRFLTLRNQR